MEKPRDTENVQSVVNKGDNFIDTAIKLAVLAIMFVATYRIISPFLMPVVWGIIIAIAVDPLVEFLSQKIGGKRKLISILFGLVVIAALIIPSFSLIFQSVEAVQEIIIQFENNTLKIPPPQGVADWPIIGEPLHKAWALASTNLEAALQKFGPQLKDAAAIILVKAGSGLKTMMMFIISVVIATALLITSDQGAAIATRIINRIAGGSGPEIKKLSIATVRGVTQGVIGVAAIQSILSVIGMLAIGIPAAGLWAILVLILAIVQLPPILILGPIAAWVFTSTDTLPAVIFLVWVVLVSGCDGVLKPILMGRGVDAPMLVLLLGALGGMMISGIIGLFVGAVVVAVSYKLFMAWIDEEEINIQSDKNE